MGTPSRQLTTFDAERLAREAEQLSEIADTFELGRLSDIFGGNVEALELVLLARILRQLGGAIEAEPTQPAPVGGGDITVQPADVTVQGGGTQVLDETAGVLRGNLRKFSLERTIEADTDIFDDDIVVDRENSNFRVLIALDTATTFAATVNKGSKDSTNDFQQGNNLTAGAFFAFDLPGLEQGAEVNYQAGADAIANVIAVSETAAGAV